MTTQPPLLTCREARQVIGVTVLGLAEPDERAALATHIAGCPDCASALDELEALPDLLATVDHEHAAAGLPDPPPELLRRIISETRVEARTGSRRRRRRLAAGLAACGVAAASAVLAVGIWGGSNAPSAPTATSPVLVASATDPDSHVHGTFTVEDRNTGSEIHLELAGVRPGERCGLIAKGPNGRQEVAGWWVAEYDGDAAVTGHSSLAAADITDLAVVTRSGRTLLEVPGSDLVTKN
jgi:hypothetical protein